MHATLHRDSPGQAHTGPEVFPGDPYSTVLSFTRPEYPPCLTDLPVYPTAHALAQPILSGLVIFRAVQVNSASPEPTPDQVRLLRSSVPPHFRLLLNILVPVP
ncbi:hypothetical protein PAXRUDRAFT_21584 [Paxillus rubicundulus Ve08.2h10]|uniref:Uncharacterized protein n=1 Tax=Paxillus rubicundulus Ve08.2h10 TaxID=930991 RepID=A0A0D0D774_9AGAM|nr:hypothetical protein PAXRUDRAFT_21584 [Paxillus rubicundulus Ve08.2h10]